MKNRKALLAQFKEQKRFMCAFIVKCEAEEIAWVEFSDRLSIVQLFLVCR